MIERCGCLRYRSFPTISQVGQIYPLFYRGKRRKCEMAQRKLKEKAVQVVCNNCFQQTVAWRDETGKLKYRCTKCGSVTISQVMSRRHIQTDMYAPQGQELIDD